MTTPPPPPASNGAPSGQRPPRDGSAYELDHDLTTSEQVRANLADILSRELLGPAEGEDEVITVAPAERYILGRIAPTRLTDSASSSATDGAGPAGAVGDQGVLDVDALEAIASTGVPAAGLDETGLDGDEDTTEGDRDDAPVRRGLMIPASMGLRFQVPTDLESFTVHASWGVYHPEAREEAGGSGRNHVFRREPVSRSETIRLADLASGSAKDYQLREDVTLRVDARREEQRWLVEVALCNDHETPRRIPTTAWLFQTALHVDAGGAAVFLPVHDLTQDPGADLGDEEEARLALQYRDRLEYAIGRTCSADWTADPGARRATQVRTTWIPSAQTPQTDARTVQDALLDMTALAAAPPEDLEAGLSPIVDAYGHWLADQEKAIANLPEHLRPTAAGALEDARQVHAQLAEGLDYLLTSEQAQRCFAFMNQVMADQRIHSQVAEQHQQHPHRPLDAAEAAVRERPHAHHWRVFQLAFILMQVPALTDPTLPRRSDETLARVELLFFPTGGGKTEAYLGLAAYAFAIRRLQGRVGTAGNPLDGHAGVTVLMRYTLRLLTAQQFQRATTLVCAAEMVRLADPATWGTEPFRIGLWVGTAVTPKRVAEAAEDHARLMSQGGQGSSFSALQISRCPWCGRPLTYRNVRIDKAEGRLRVYCPDPLSTCPFSEGGRAGEGVPVLTTDEEIYRLLPAFVIATVDKLARLAREGQAAALFGYVARRCPRHGYVPQLDHHGASDDATCTTKAAHPASGTIPAARILPVGRLRPPDLIIQDELHLITGALGTTVGLFEVAVDAMTTWRTTSANGTIRTVRPLIVASSATVRKAGDQVLALYGRRPTIFPPRVLDASDTFFSVDKPITPQTPGRLYLGLSTTGVRLTNAEILTAQVLLAAGQLLLDRAGRAADPYMTLVGYFSATRELAGMARYIQDDVQTALSKGMSGSLLPRRTGARFGTLRLGELTSRIDSTAITATLEDMADAFDPDTHSTPARAARAAAFRAARDGTGPRPDEPTTSPFDVVLATSMLQVGVDVTRLGLMLIVGQPKNTAEYIQASSRVGRDADRPGLVVSLGNWARPRDLAHYEQFRHFHETFYARVEPLSVTPFSATNLERGLDGVLVAAARVLTAAEAVGSTLSPERDAGAILRSDVADRLVQALVARTVRSGVDEATERFVRERLLGRVDQWRQRATEADRVPGASGEAGTHLAYERTGDGDLDLIRSAEATGPRTAKGLAPFVVANSMREVQPEINLLVSPSPARLAWVEPDDAPAWSAQIGSEEDA